MLREMSLTIALLFLTSGVLTNAQKSAGGKETTLTVSAGGPLVVECPLRVEQRAEWRLNGSGVPEDLRPAGEQAAGEGRLTARLRAAAARVQHAGLYTCSREPDAARVRVRVLPAAPPHAPPAGEGAVAAGGATDIAEDTPQVVYFDINRNFVLVCPIEADKDGYKWSKGNESVSEVAALKDRFQLEEGGAQFRLPHKAHEDDYGVYQCAAAGQRRAFDVRARPLVRLPDNTNVVENQNIKLQCKVLGKPTPRVWWTYNKTEDSNESRPLTTDGRITLLPNEQGVADATLELREAARADAGLYACHAAAADGAAVRDHTTLRVKDMYAALWPFLGICAEVFVLCAIILVYEKRRTKPELDDSDTDNHDQKKS